MGSLSPAWERDRVRGLVLPIRAVLVEARAPSTLVIPAQAGIQGLYKTAKSKKAESLGPRLRGDDGLPGQSPAWP
ncbi:hypothetical protein DLREEDagrD3_02510 [Denitratisoma sp. agr-D3]